MEVTKATHSNFCPGGCLTKMNQASGTCGQLLN